MKNKLKGILKKLRDNWLPGFVEFIKDPLFLNKWTRDDWHTRDSNRLTIWVNSGYKSFIERDQYIGDVFMFVEDMHTQVMPYSSVRHSSDNSYSAKIKPANRQTEDLIAKALSRDRFSRDLSDSLAEFIRNGVQTILAHGKIAYEVETTRNNDGAITELKIHMIYPPSIRKFFGIYWQIIPWAAAKHGHVRVGIHRIPSERILWIQFPRKLGGRRKLRRILKELAFISKEVMPKFQMKLMEGQKDSGFNFSKYIWDRYIFKGKITRNFGWDQRKFGSDDMLEYYSLVRQLRFAKTQAILREHILERLNSLLKNPYVGIQSEIVTENLLKPEELDAQLATLRQGDIEFKSIYDKITNG